MRPGSSLPDRGARLEAERVREEVSRYIDRHGWDVAEDDEAWRQYQRRRMREDYGGDDWSLPKESGAP